MRRILAILLVVMLAIAMVPAFAQDEETFTLTVLHTNDTHTYHDGPTRGTYAGQGGVARLATVVNQIRAAQENVLLFDAGDRFTGTLFHAIHLGQDNARITNALAYDAMTLGNHEFDNGPQVLADFIDAVDFPIVGANIIIDPASPLAGKIQPSVVLEVGGQQIGVVGLITPETAFLARPQEGVSFAEDTAAAIQAEVDVLTGQGINKIILVSHQSYGLDQELAAQVTGVDVIIGGDSESLLSNRLTAAEGPYPTLVDSPAGEPVAIVQAFRWNVFLGRLDVTFDAAGVIISATGEPIFLSEYIAQDADVQTIVEDLRAPVADEMQTPIGEAAVFLLGVDERRNCREVECNLANLVADALRWETGADIGFMNGGGIRASIEEGPVSRGAVLDVLPFFNRAATMTLTGEQVLAAVENGLSRIGAPSGTGRFLQVSGMCYVWDGTQEVGSRVVSVGVQDESGAYVPLDLNARYTVVANDFMAGGGDEYTMLAAGENLVTDLRTLDAVVIDYIASEGTVQPMLEGRIVRIDTDDMDALPETACPIFDAE